MRPGEVVLLIIDESSYVIWITLYEFHISHVVIPIKDVIPIKFNVNHPMLVL